MKRLISLIMLGVMLLSLVACSKTTADTEVHKGEVEVEQEVVSNTNSLEILENVWASYKDTDKFAVAGGDYDHMVQDKPGEIDVTKGEDLDALFGFPADKIEMVNNGASLMHMMNQNTFTASAYHVSDCSGPGLSVNIETLAESVKSNIVNRQWICGCPDKLVIYNTEIDYLVVAFGAEDVVDTFEEYLNEVYPSATLLYDEDLNI